eukprot:g3289.t1
MILSNLIDLGVTLMLVSSCLILTEEWSHIANSKLKRTSTSRSSWHAARVVKITAISLIWCFGVGGCILEQVLLPPEDGDGSLPETVLGGSLFDFRGVYHTSANAIKNLSHGVIGFCACLYSSAMLFRIRRRLIATGNQSKNVQKLVTTLLEYVVGVNFCLALDLGYALVSASSRLRSQYYFEFPPCSAYVEFLHIPDIMKLLVFMICLWVTRHTESKERQKNDRNKPTNESTTSSSYVKSTTDEDPSEGAVELVSSSSTTQLVNSDSSSTLP